MGKKSKRNREASKKQQSARVQQGGVTNTITNNDVAAAVVGNEIELSTTSSSTSASIRIDPIDSLRQLVEKGDHEGIITLESNLVLRATVLEGIEPQKASYIYFMVAKAFDVTGNSSMIARGKAIHYMKRSFALSDKEIILQACVRQLLPFVVPPGRAPR